MSETVLRHNPSNPITAGIWRVQAPDGTVHVRKRLSGSRGPVHPDWSASHDPRDWRYWRREAEVYAAGLQDVYAAEGIRGPRVLEVAELPDGDVVLRMEQVRGRSGAALTVDDLVDVAHRLGAAQGRLAREPVDHPWLSRGFLADHIASKRIDPGWLDADRAWSHPLVATHWPSSLREGLAWLWESRAALVSRAAAAPRTLGHLDCWSHNLFAVEGGYALIDWACAGDAALGEDASNLVYEAVLDGFVPPGDLPELSARVLEAYLDGVRASGWPGPLDAVRAGYLASAVKWCWMGPLHLQRAIEGGHHVYGGGQDCDPAGQYRARGLALAHAVQEARASLTIDLDANVPRFA